jgi:hypothetical protein
MQARNVVNVVTPEAKCRHLSSGCRHPLDDAVSHSERKTYAQPSSCRQGYSKRARFHSFTPISMGCADDVTTLTTPDLVA